MDMQNFLLQVSGLTPGRAATILPAIMGLISVVIGWRALVRSSGRVGASRLMVILVLVLGLIDMVFSGLHLARATSGFGTGSGKLGAIVAFVLGVIGVVLGVLAWGRSRRMAVGNKIDR